MYSWQPTWDIILTSLSKLLKSSTSILGSWAFTATSMKVKSPFVSFIDFNFALFTIPNSPWPKISPEKAEYNKTTNFVQLTSAKTYWSLSDWSVFQKYHPKVLSVANCLRITGTCIHFPRFCFTKRLLKVHVQFVIYWLTFVDSQIQSTRSFVCVKIHWKTHSFLHQLNLGFVPNHEKRNNDSLFIKSIYNYKYYN